MVALVQRYRHSNTIERLQLKWIAYVGAGIAIAMPIASFQIDVFSDLAWGIGITMVAALPVAVAFAILRYRLYDIDRLISRTIVYGGLTAILAGLYTASIRLFNGVFVAVTGEESDAALVITTLILATTLTPIRRWLEGIVEGRAREPLPAAGEARAADAFSDPAYIASLTELVEGIVKRVLRRRQSEPTAAAATPEQIPGDAASPSARASTANLSVGEKPQGRSRDDPAC